MSDDPHKNLPALMGERSPALHGGGPLGPAAAVRNPLRAFFQVIGDDATIAVLNSQGRVLDAMNSRIEKQTKVVHTQDAYQLALRTFQAHQLGLALPDEQDKLEEEQHQRALAKKRREKEQHDADEQALQAKLRAMEVQEKLEARVIFKEHKIAAGEARFAQKIAERKVGEAVARASVGDTQEPERPQERENGSGFINTIVQGIDEIEKRISDAEAAGRPSEELRLERDAVNRLLRRHLQSP